jgi:class 3 adenylate cyclase
VAAAAEVLRRFSATVRSSATEHAGRILKQIGDAFMLMFTQPAHAIEFGLAMHRFVDAESLFPALHIGARTTAPCYTARVITSVTRSIWPRGWRQLVPRGSS